MGAVSGVSGKVIHDKKKCQGNTCISYDIQINVKDVIPVYPMIIDKDVIHVYPMIYRSVIRMVVYW